MDLFRKLRLQLLSDRKLSNYLIFAIGEIILIVVGILIALYINNLNEERKLSNEIKKYKISLISDLNKDLQSIKKEIDSLKNDTTKLSEFFQRISQPAVTVDTLTKIFRYEFNCYAWGSITFNNNTVNSMKSTGIISNLEDWLQNALIEILELKENYYSIRDDLNTYVDLLLLEPNHYPVNEPGQWMNLKYKNSELSNKIWKQAKFEELGAYMFHLFTVKYTIEAGAIEHLKQIELKSNSVLERLNAEPESYK